MRKSDPNSGTGAVKEVLLQAAGHERTHNRRPGRMIRLTLRIIPKKNNHDLAGAGVESHIGGECETEGVVYEVE
jgi:cation transport regulator ChaC